MDNIRLPAEVTRVVIQSLSVSSSTAFMKIEGHIYCGKRLCSCRYITEKSEIIIEKYGDIILLEEADSRYAAQASEDMPE